MNGGNSNKTVSAGEHRDICTNKKTTNKEIDTPQTHYTQQRAHQQSKLTVKHKTYTVHVQ